jgi:tetratricopeptide (TPR) repeat protein
MPKTASCNPTTFPEAGQTRTGDTIHHHTILLTVIFCTGVLLHRTAMPSFKGLSRNHGQSFQESTRMTERQRTGKEEEFTFAASGNEEMQDWLSAIDFAFRCNNEAAFLQVQGGTSMEHLFSLYQDAIESVQRVAAKIEANTPLPLTESLLEDSQKKSLYRCSKISSASCPLLLYHEEIGELLSMGVDALSFISAALLYNMGLLLAQNNLTADARELFSLVILVMSIGVEDRPVCANPVLHPSFAIATHLHLAELSASQGLLQEALSSYSESLSSAQVSHIMRVDVSFAHHVCSGMGSVLMRLGLYEEAGMMYSEASEILFLQELQVVHDTELPDCCHAPAA